MSDAELTALGLVVIGFFMIAMILSLMMILGMWKMFKKADRPQWAAIVPFYNSWVLSEISGRPGWWSLASLVPVLSWAWWILFSYELAQRFSKNNWFVAFLVFLPPIAILTLGCDKSKYEPLSEHSH